ncbi:MAG: hypothetical protein MUO77_11435 [Anaerolineales bacterium]|nr:hypothetical protein [Anaerolineales bacterium]
MKPQPRTPKDQSRGKPRPRQPVVRSDPAHQRMQRERHTQPRLLGAGLGGISLRRLHPAQQIFLLKLVPYDNNATFPKDAVYSYGGTFGLSLGVDMQSPIFGRLTICSGSCLIWSEP